MSKHRYDPISILPVSGPRDIAFADSNGDMFVTSFEQHCVHVYDKFFAFKKTIGSCGIAGKDKLQFNEPHGIAINGNTVYVAEYAGNRIHMFTTEGEFIDTFGTEKRLFFNPHDVKISPDKKIYVADRSNDCVRVFNMDWSISHVISNDYLFFPEGVAFDHDSGNVHITWYSSSKVTVFTADGKLDHEYRKWPTGMQPKGIAIDPSTGYSFVTAVGPRGPRSEEGFLFVFDRSGNHIYSIDKGLTDPFGISLNKDGSIWVADRDNNRIVKYY